MCEEIQFSYHQLFIVILLSNNSQRVGHNSWILLGNCCHVCKVERFKPDNAQSSSTQTFPRGGSCFRCYALCAEPWVTYVAPRYQKIEAKKITVMRSSMGTNMKFRKLTPGHTMQ